LTFLAIVFVLGCVLMVRLWNGPFFFKPPESPHPQAHLLPDYAPPEDPVPDYEPTDHSVVLRRWIIGVAIVGVVVAILGGVLTGVWRAPYLFF
jgi:mannose/fructose/N-acetylgalactosamine-specific phosphotransferase system component IIC